MTKEKVSDCLISVVIPTLDRAAAVSRCIEALLSAERPPDEVLVIDQSTGDATASRVETLLATAAASGTAIVYEHHPPLSLSGARNRGIESSSGSVVAMTDDDCVPTPSWISAIAHAICVEGAEVVTGPVRPLGPSQRGLYPVSLRTSTERVYHRRGALPWRVGTGGNLAIRRDVLASIGRFDERLGVGTPGRAGEDVDFLHRLLQAGRVVRYEPNAGVLHARQSRARRRLSRYSYGHGMGAFSAIALANRDAHGLLVGARWALDHSRSLLRSMAAGDREKIGEQLLSLQGLEVGLVRGISDLVRGQASKISPPWL